MGKLIVLEGLDGSGKGTQAQMLADALRRQGRDFRKLSFPNYQSDSSALVKMYLRGDFGAKPDDVNAYAASAFYAVDRYAGYKSGWGKFYQNGWLMVSDRYTTSNAMHQCAKLPRGQWDGYLNWLFDFEYGKLGIPAPDKVIYLAVDGTFAGFLALADTLRQDSAAMVASLHRLGVTPVLLTGDREAAAKAIAGELGIRQVYGECLPQEKLDRIGAFQEKGQLVCMMGDGVNDAPALKKAHVGIAMGGVGSDIAVDAADIALVDDEVKELPHLIALSRRMMTTIKVNLTFSMALNFVAIVLAMTGILNPVVGALVHNAGSVLVIVNSALLLRFRSSPKA